MPKLVNNIHQLGGTLLGTSRGPVSPDIIVDFLEQRGINILFTVGGDGTQRGAHGIVEEIQRRKLKISVIGIPKTIDDDVQYVNRSFGYFTAIEKAKEVIDSAHVEAHCVLNGISIVKVMGRDSGFIAAGATLASQEVNFALVPEVPFHLEGDCGLLACLHRRMLERHHAVIVVAEGAGQHLLPSAEEHDASGNRLHRDIGLFLRAQIREYFAEQRHPVVIRYFDPSYYIRSVPASTVDSVLVRFVRAPRCPRRHERQNRYDRRPAARSLHPRADPYGDHNASVFRGKNGRPSSPQPASLNLPDLYSATSCEWHVRSHQMLFRFVLQGRCEGSAFAGLQAACTATLSQVATRRLVS